MKSNTYLEIGSRSTALSEPEIAEALKPLFRDLGPRRKVLAIPPDYTRAHSRAGQITRAVYDHFADALTDIMPALGTHQPLTADHREAMYPGIPADRFRDHRWRDDVVVVGTVPAREVETLTEGAWNREWQAELNRRIVEGGHDLILSVGQVVPHEVTGMANHAKNLFVGCGGARGINESHYIGALYGMERIMGRADTPTRALVSLALERFASRLPIVFVLTVVGRAAAGEPADPHGLVTRGLFAGAGMDCFYAAANLAREVNVTLLDEAVRKAVVYLDPGEYQSTWLGNKSIYRTRMAMADGGELVVLAPGVKRFGEDSEIDKLIRKYGYRTTDQVRHLVDSHEELQANLSAAAHLIHGSSEGRFCITYCPGHLTRSEVEGVGYRYDDPDEMAKRYDPDALVEGWNCVEGEKVFFVSNPGLGLWSERSRFA